MTELVHQAPEDTGIGRAELDGEGVRLTAAQQKRRRARSVAIALALFAFVVVFYVVTIAKIGGNIAMSTGGAMGGG
jgi:hypothetical protein